MSVDRVSRAVIWPCVSLITLICTVFVHYASVTGLIFEMCLADVSSKYELMITPSGWQFWSIIYTWQFLWIIYIAVLCCKQEMRAIVLGPVFYVAFIASNLLSTAWIIAFVNSLIVVSEVFLFLSTIAMCISAAAAHHYVVIKADSSSEYYDSGQEIPHWMDETVSLVLTALALNGTAFYAQWLLIASVLQFGVILCFEARVENETASFVTLAVLTAFLILHCALDFNSRTRKLLRFTFTPYITFIVTFAAMISEHGVDAEQCAPSIMTLLLLILSILAFALKLYRSFFGYSADTSWDAAFLSIDY